MSIIRLACYIVSWTVTVGLLLAFGFFWHRYLRGFHYMDFVLSVIFAGSGILFGLCVFFLIEAWGRKR